MKNYILTILILLASLQLFSQDTLSSNTSLEKVTYLTERISHDLGIKSDQKDQLFDILYIRSTGIEELKNLDYEEFVQELNDINSATIKSLEEVLTPDQLMFFLKLRKDKKAAKEEFKEKNPGYTFTKEDEELDF